MINKIRPNDREESPAQWISDSGDQVDSQPPQVNIRDAESITGVQVLHLLDRYRIKACLRLMFKFEGTVWRCAVASRWNAAVDGA